jgi:hypothetical protein
MIKIVIALKLCSGREHESPNGKEVLKDRGVEGIKMPMRRINEEMRKLVMDMLKYEPVPQKDLLVF